MTDFSKLTDKQINEAMQSFPNSMCLLDKKGNRKLIDYVADDAFCFRLIKEHKMSVENVIPRWDVEVTIFNGGAKRCRGINKNLNRAVLECYLKMKEVLK